MVLIAEKWGSPSKPRVERSMTCGLGEGGEAWRFSFGGLPVAVDKSKGDGRNFKGNHG